MTQQHPTTPPPELVRQWIDQDEGGPNVIRRIATRAAQWGADQELEACCGWLLDSAPWTVGPGERIEWVETLAMCRRPKPPSLKEQALKTFEEAPGPDHPMAMTVLNAEQHALIRRALEALPDD